MRVRGALGTLVLCAGCSTAGLDAAGSRAAVSSLVRERTGREDAIRSAAPEDPVVVDRIHSLLDEGLTAERAAEITLVNNRALRALYTDLDVAESDLVQATLLHNPVVDVAAALPIAGGAVDLTFGVAIDVIDLVYAPLRKRVAEARLDETKLRVAGEILDFAGRAETAFFRHQANAQMLDMRRQVLESTDAGFQLSRRLRQAGNVTELQVASERALAEEARLDLRSAELAVRESTEELNGLMGLWGEAAGTWKTASSRLPDPPDEALDVDRIETRAVERSLDLAAAERIVVAAGEALGLDRASALFPELVVGGKGERDNGSWQPGPTLSIPIPIFDRGQARIARARAELERARELHHALAVRVRVAIRTARDRLAGARDRALHYKNVLLPVRDEIVQETQLQYNAMQIGPLDLLRAKERQIESGAKYIESLRDYWTARAEVGLILAGRLPSNERFPAAPPLEQLPRFPFPTLGP